MTIQSAALFDLDHTLLRVNSSFAFGLFLYKRGILTTPRMLFLAGSYLQHKTNFLSAKQLHQRSFHSLFKGMDSSKLDLLVLEWLDQKWDSLLYLPLIQELKTLQAQGSYTCILSNSPDFIVAPIAKRLKVDDWLATQYAKDSHGKLCRIHQLVEGQEKANYTTLLSKNNSIPRNSIAAYSDSFLDAPFLETAGRPIAVRPDRKLKALCKKKQWEIRL